eukprot:scaffold650898_cov43-Prasinocladus_malaysianus.AAC.1
MLGYLGPHGLDRSQVAVCNYDQQSGHWRIESRITSTTDGGHNPLVYLRSAVIACIIANVYVGGCAFDQRRTSWNRGRGLARQR